MGPRSGGRMADGTTGRGKAIGTVLFVAYGVAMVAVLCLLFLLPTGRWRWLVFAGWAVFAVSAVLGWLPIFVFRRRGGVAKRRSYIHTTQLVTTGLYAIFRHPQYLAGDYIAVAVMCITQHWATLVAGGIGIATNRLSMIVADRALVEKFGDPYREYMARVPRASLLLGLWRRLKRTDP